MRIKQKITFVIWRADLGGSEKSIFYYLENLKNEFDLEIFSLKRPVNNIFSDKDVKVYVGGENHLSAYLQFIKYSFQNRSNIFHLMNAGPLVLLFSKILALKKLIYHIRGTRYFKNPKTKLLFRALWYLALDKKQVFLANSFYSKKRFEEQISNKMNVQLLYNAFDQNKFVLKTRGLSNKILIIYVGRFVDGKNLIKWIETADFILRKRSDVQFKLIGSGNLKMVLAKKIRELNRDDFIQFQDYTEHIEKEYQIADIIMFFSEYESFGNVMVESILCGTPVIANKIPATTEIFSKYPEFLISLEDGFEQKVLDKINDLENLKETAKVAREDFIKRFSLEGHLMALTNIYNSF